MYFQTKRNIIVLMISFFFVLELNAIQLDSHYVLSNQAKCDHGHDFLLVLELNALQLGSYYVLSNQTEYNRVNDFHFVLKLNAIQSSRDGGLSRR